MNESWWRNSQLAHKPMWCLFLRAHLMTDASIKVGFPYHSWKNKKESSRQRGFWVVWCCGVTERTIWWTLNRASASSVQVSCTHRPAVHFLNTLIHQVALLMTLVRVSEVPTNKAHHSPTHQPHSLTLLLKLSKNTVGLSNTLASRPGKQPPPPSQRVWWGWEWTLSPRRTAFTQSLLSFYFDGTSLPVHLLRTRSPVPNEVCESIRIDR